MSKDVSARFGRPAYTFCLLFSRIFHVLSRTSMRPSTFFFHFYHCPGRFNLWDSQYTICIPNDLEQLFHKTSMMNLYSTKSLLFFLTSLNCTWELLQWRRHWHGKCNSTLKVCKILLASCNAGEVGFNSSGTGAVNPNRLFSTNF